MCGICGIFNYAGRIIQKDTLLKMSAVLNHRGPDDEGCYFDAEAGWGIAHRRLSIIDLSGGHQPMSSADGMIWITYNGEIYNFPELRKELTDNGCLFRTASDTEVILCMYGSYGVASFERLNGIFAFALFDKRENRLILARDHFGVKPLYYTIVDGQCIFGSEIKAILEHPAVKREIDYQALSTFLTFRYNPSPHTLFKGIIKLAPGHFLSVSTSGQVITDSYWNYQPSINHKISEYEAIEEYQLLLEQAVKRQMISDVPVGLLLSGGIDSAVIGYLMQKNCSYPIKSFTIGFEGKGDYNELSDAQNTASLIRTNHHELILSQNEYLDFFYKSFFYTEEPIAETTIPALYYLTKLASSGSKVVLAGQGADEPLAGYPRYYGEHLLSKYAGLFDVIPLNKIARFLPRNEKFKRAAFASQYKRERDRFLAIYTIFTPEQKNKLFNADMIKTADEINLDRLNELYTNVRSLDDSLAKILFIDTRMSLSDNLLLFGDKISMANSLEMRVPFLDINLIKFLESLPSNFKLKGRTHKFIHKRAVKKWLPETIINRRKKGFLTPMDEWLQNDLASKAKIIINERKSASRLYFNLEYINHLIDQHQKRRENYQRHIFLLLSFELWHRQFFSTDASSESPFKDVKITK